MDLPAVSALEFEQIRSSIKTFVKTKTDFQDYDFEGSNLSMLIDILAYNTLYTSHMVSMSANELNLDTAVFRDNVVSLAKRLGYTPGSYSSAFIDFKLNFNTLSYDKIKLHKGPIFSASSNGKNFNFILREDLYFDCKNKTTLEVSDLRVFEGTELQIYYTVDTSNEHQRYFVPNNYVDVDSIRVFVISDPTNNFEDEYTKKSTLVDVDASSKIFFVEEIQDQKYEIIFGDDVFGRRLLDGEVVKIQYVVSSGSSANFIRANSFNFTGKISSITNGIETQLPSNYYEETVLSEYSDGGSEFETIKSIKYAAPRYFSSQERAVTAADYEAIIHQIYQNIELIRVVGGESMNPPQYGKVIITIKPLIGDRLSDGVKKQILLELKKYQVGSLNVEIRDPEPVFVHSTPVVIYDRTKTKKSAEEIRSLIVDRVLEYNESPDFDKFNGQFSNSIIKNIFRSVDTSIKYVHNRVFLQKQFILTGPGLTQYTIEFNVKLDSASQSNFYILTDYFCVPGVAKPVYIGARTSVQNCEFTGKLNLYTIDNEFIREIGVINEQIGTLNFELEVCPTCVLSSINISVIPDITEFEVGQVTYPTIELDDIIVMPFDEVPFLSDYLDEDIINLPEQLLSDCTGEDGDPSVNPGTTPNVIVTEDSDGNQIIVPSESLIPSTGGVIPINVPIIPGTTTPPPDDGDPNNIENIDNFTPEIDPTVCT